ncbi:cupin domain-containing protein [Celeribacter litoreus]|uniref:cupin domain-containing protein n=1 Tax=Celeribacter litoreus TaxID=2876714 RepID=UPI001CCBBC89|nr:cupin domain-containing protein [Celeribacter litoreus]MCA0043580.1 cupin domain-containing protein [Celeribacter litoreus]
MPKLCDVEAIWMLGGVFRSFRQDGAPPGGTYLLEQVLPHGFSPPRHIHHNEDETFYMLAGEISFLVGDEIVKIRAGDVLCAPKGVPHTFVVTSEEGARMLTITDKGEFEAMVRTAGHVADYDGLPPNTGEPTSEDILRLEAACRANGIEVVGPPLAAAA